MYGYYEVDVIGSVGGYCLKRVPGAVDEIEPLLHIGQSYARSVGC